MPAHPARAAPPPESDSPIAPQQLWGCLSASQQQHVRKVLIGVAQQLLAHLHNPPLFESRVMHLNLHLGQVKITPLHLERKAVIYIRQSSPQQVREHLDSQLTQRTLVRRAQSLGWHPDRIEVFNLWGSDSPKLASLALRMYCRSYERVSA